MRYSIRPIPGGYEATIPLPLKDGSTLTISARATFAEVQRDLARHRRGVQGAHEDATTEGFFGSIGHFVKKLTRSKALRKAVHIVGKVVKNPVFSAAVAVIPGVGVPLAGGIQAAVAAEKLLRNATKAPKGSAKRVAARATLKAASIIAQREAKARRAGKVVVPPNKTVQQRAFRYLVNLQPAA